MPRSGGLYIHLTLDSPFLKRLFSEGWGGSVGRALSHFFGVFLGGGQPPMERRTGNGSGSVCVSAPTLIDAVSVSRPVPIPRGERG